MAALLASGFLPGSGGIPPELLATFPGMKPDKPLESSRSPSRSSTPSRASPSVHRHSKNPPSDPSQLTGEERVTIVNVTTGKKVGRYCLIFYWQLYQSISHLKVSIAILFWLKMKSLTILNLSKTIIASVLVIILQTFR